MTSFVLNGRLCSFFLCLFTLESGVDAPRPPYFFENAHENILVVTPPQIFGPKMRKEFNQNTGVSRLIPKQIQHKKKLFTLIYNNLKTITQ